MVRSIKRLLIVISLLFIGTIHAQRKDVKGQLISNDEVEGLHIQNRTAAKYTISNDDGSFIIPVQVSDTLVVSGVKYHKQEVIITSSIVELGQLNVLLIENVSELKEVIVGKILTGSLESDMENSDAEPEINFYDLGIPGYTGKQMTQNERKLYDADAGAMMEIVGGVYGGGPSVNLNKLLNTISGRTNKLKAIVEIDNREQCIQRLRADYESFLFEKDTLAEHLRNEYFLFCSEDDSFLALCHKNNEIELLEFLQSMLKVYQENRKSVSKD